MKSSTFELIFASSIFKSETEYLKIIVKLTVELLIWFKFPAKHLGRGMEPYAFGLGQINFF